MPIEDEEEWIDDEEIEELEDGADLSEDPEEEDDEDFMLPEGI